MECCCNCCDKMAAAAIPAELDRDDEDRQREPDEDELNGNGGGDHREEARSGLARHVGPFKQLHCASGHNLAISKEQVVYGTREPYNADAVLVVVAVGRARVQIRGRVSKSYVAMNGRGKIYAEPDQGSENTIWKERFIDGWNYYIWIGSKETDWYLGIKKSGKLKRGNKTRYGQKAIKFSPRPAQNI